jgi:hypothetical protein
VCYYRRTLSPYGEIPGNPLFQSKFVIKTGTRNYIVPGACFPNISGMHFTSIDINLAFILVIALHGFVLSFFFFINSRFRLNPNFFLGLLLFVISTHSFIRIFCLQNQHVIINNVQSHFLHALLISPFLFLYNFVMMHNNLPDRMNAHFLIIMISFLLIVIIGPVVSPKEILLVVCYIVVNLLYLFGSFCMLFGSISAFPGITFINLLVSGIVIADLMFYISQPVNSTYLLLSSKCLIICYIYYLILRRADFGT